MEHKLILGGEQWLPFARSRIKAIRHMAYASQKFTMPDGAEVEVRVSDGVEYIRISGGEIKLEMDSGAVSIGAIGEAAPARYDPGVLHEAGPAKAYNLPFVQGPGDGRTNPGKGSNGQFAGLLTKRERFSGRIRDEARSFYPRIELKDGDFVPSPSDDTLAAKKRVGILCPPSLFTGKCRLYVQAMYGLPLYEYNAAQEVVHTNTPMDFVSENSSAPELVLPSYKAVNDTGVYPDMLLNTSCGVWLDEKTGNHWLFKPGTNAARVIPLKARPDVEKLRRWLVPTGNAPLNAVDREHLEAYILAYSLPDQKNAQSSLPGAVDTGGVYPMGYGWKWKWSGEKPIADLVNVGTYLQDESNAAMVSTHFRLTASILPGDGPARWKTEIEVIEGPTQWVVYRFVWTLAGPNYYTMVLEKTTNQHSLQFECDAPFYCFYLKDELQMCRVKVTLNQPDTPVREISAGYGDGAYGGPVTYRTLGLLGGAHEDIRGDGTYFSAVFSCGQKTTPSLPWGKTNFGNKSALTNKSLVDMIDTGFGVSSYQTKTYNVGYPGPDGSYPQSGAVFGRYYDWSGIVEYDLQEVGVQESTNSLATIVVPFYDAEAIYVQASVDLLRTENGAIQRLGADVAGFGYVWENRVDLFGTEIGRFRYFGWNNGGGASGANIYSTTPVNTAVISVLSSDESLVSHAGVTPATFTNMGEFHSNALESVGAEFGTISGTSVEQPTVIAPGYAGPIGADGASGASVLVGWI